MQSRFRIRDGSTLIIRCSCLEAHVASDDDIFRIEVRIVVLDEVDELRGWLWWSSMNSLAAWHAVRLTSNLLLFSFFSNTDWKSKTISCTRQQFCKHLFEAAKPVWHNRVGDSPWWSSGYRMSRIDPWEQLYHGQIYEHFTSRTFFVGVKKRMAWNRGCKALVATLIFIAPTHWPRYWLRCWKCPDKDSETYHM